MNVMWKITGKYCLMLRITATACFCTSADYYKAQGNLAEIRISVEGIRSHKGRLLLAIYHNEKNFKNNQNPVAAVQRMVFAEKSEIVFRGRFSPGNFAIVVLHDEDNDGKLKSSQGGIPLEGFGFSNNPALSRGKPGWDDTRFSVTGKSHAETIKLVYLD